METSINPSFIHLGNTDHTHIQRESETEKDPVRYRRVLLKKKKAKDRRHLHFV